MAKRRTASPAPEPTTLTKTKSQFKAELKERIEAGEELLKTNVQNQNDYDELADKYSMWHDYNIELLKQSFNYEGNEYKKSYENVASLNFMVLGGRSNAADEFRKFIEKFNAKIANLKKLVQKIDLLKSTEPETQISDPNSVEINTSEVFIVHGHDDLAKNETARFITQLGFKPIILHEQASSGKTIIEKIEHYSNVGFGIILYTPCDVGAKSSDTDNLKARARQNVVFEHGYLIGKIGRENVAALVKGNVETPNDISGVVYLSMTNDWKLELAKELRNSGYDVDMNKVI
jgi:predicted nucleotide-binding protein